MKYLKNGHSRLVVSGIMRELTVLELQPIFVSEFGLPQPEVSDNSNLVIIEGLDRGGEILFRSFAAAATQCTFPMQDKVACFTCTIPNHPDMNSMRVYYYNELLEEVDLSGRRPYIRITQQPRGGVRGQHRIAWKPRSPGDGLLHYILMYSYTNQDGKRAWLPLGAFSGISEFVVDLDELPGGRNSVRVFVSNGKASSMIETDVFTVPLKGYQSLIIMPDHPLVLTAGEICVLHGQGFNVDEHRSETEYLEWQSSLDGLLGTGSPIRVQLSTGRHDIKLLSGRGPLAGSSQIQVDVIEMS